MITSVSKMRERMEGWGEGRGEAPIWPWLQQRSYVETDTWFGRCLAPKSSSGL